MTMTTSPLGQYVIDEPLPDWWQPHSFYVRRTDADGNHDACVFRADSPVKAVDQARSGEYSWRRQRKDGEAWVAVPRFLEDAYYDAEPFRGLV